jgi:hypothetical protein
VSRVRDAVQAAELWKEVIQSADPGRMAERILDRLEHQAENAEARQISEEQFLAQAVERMERTAHARQVAAKAAAEQRRVEGMCRREMERRRKNARARERYQQRRLTEGARVNKRIRMHALAIQVDPAAYRAVKAEALQRGTSIPGVIAEILSDSSRQPIASANPTEPRWRRTGEGRKANQHTRIDIDDDAWLAVRRDAVRHGLTIARWIGLNLETWARRGDVEESRAAR